MTYLAPSLETPAVNSLVRRVLTILTAKSADYNLQSILTTVCLSPHIAKIKEITFAHCACAHGWPVYHDGRLDVWGGRRE